eukprot:CAMPEP_0198555128 /NCGR_PEP_ID=MMETSP1462-20131121/84064_1 /TAXON_ID=1333877 /ORGANISM="Brandtodinium nutriculum, Strain RCC3387" /LENGTH=92 /DNA_ID=CAMNT_0044285851 /DNA_START=15 /DNA_END=290 /DNA_ORIENTATION=+
MSVAVKIISRLSFSQQTLTLSPEVEAELSVLVSHPNLVKTHLYGLKPTSSNPMAASPAASFVADQGGMDMWMVQEWCDGGTLREYCTVPKLG